jgi:dipeptidyl aminopeptidase/acylaminoacyl peptidase
VERVAEIAAPILALMGGADEAIPRADVEAFERALTEAGVEHEVKIYEGAPHSFFDRRFDEHAEASADAWARVLAFIERYSSTYLRSDPEGVRTPRIRSPDPESAQRRRSVARSANT